MLNWYRSAYRYPPASGRERRVEAPTLLLIPPDDAFLASDVSRASVRFVADGRVVELSAGTHWVAQEYPDAITAILVDFFRQ
jgi:pimeloyl-ACP methyl ester carboxylesterase